jgi:hypothetical protein
MVIQQLQAKLAAADHALQVTNAESQSIQSELRAQQHAMDALAGIFCQEHPTRVEAQARLEVLAQQWRETQADVEWVKLQMNIAAADLAFHHRCWASEMMVSEGGGLGGHGAPVWCHMMRVTVHCMRLHWSMHR